MSEALVSTGWLADNLGAPDLRVVDATWYLPTLKRDARAGHAQAHIGNAVFFDVDEIAAEASPYPHMLPSPTRFSSMVRKLGLGDGLRLVIYDDNRFIASARAWWMFRLFGHPEVFVLDGGLAKWRAEGRSMESGQVSPAQRHFTARQNSLILREIDQVRGNLTTRREQLVDARSAGRFLGSEPEPRPGLRGGHIPSSLSLPYLDLLAPDGTLRPKDELERRLRASGLDPERPIVTTCGSGVSAAVINLALFELGRPDAALYDGSWSEWAAQSDTPVSTTPSR